MKPLQNPFIPGGFLATTVKNLFLIALVSMAMTQATLSHATLAFSSDPTADDIFRARVFEEPLVPIGGNPSSEENAALAAALTGYSKRREPDDFSSLTKFLEGHPKSPWRAALLTGVGLEYYKEAYYSLALKSWQEAWLLAQNAPNAAGKFLADRAVCELAGLYSRLGRMDELEILLKSVETRLFIGGTSERINIAREALWNMKQRPEVSFRCGPLALQSVKRSLNAQALLDNEIFNSASTKQGFSLPQVADLSKKVGLNYQMAFREKGGAFVIPSVVHWKVGHYAALVRQDGDRYVLEDPTFGNTVWATRAALEAETSGYFLIPPGPLPEGWRAVVSKEGEKIWGKGVVSGIDADNYTPNDLQTGSCIAGRDAMGMAISRVHLGLVNLQVRDTPLGYTPPVGPAVRFTVRYNHRDYLQLVHTIPGMFGAKWTHDWNGRIIDNPNNPLADVKYGVAGGGVRTFTGFNTNTQTFAAQQFDQTLLKRINTNTYEMLFPDGSKKIFGRRESGSVALTQVMDSAGNAVTLTWENFGFLTRLVSLTDAIGQVTTLSYEHPLQSGLITKITDPFGRFASFEYRSWEVDHDNNPLSAPLVFYILNKITDVIGLTSRFEYLQGNDIMARMITPYGTNSFSLSAGTSANDVTRFVETTYPDGTKDRVEFNQSESLGIANSDPPASVPQGMSTGNAYLAARNTYYWDRNAYAMARGDYKKAKIYHWLHAPNIATMAGALESIKAPLEGRIWFNYAGQSSPVVIGNSDKPARIGRVLDDGTTQLHTREYNGLGHLTNSIDPIGRRFSFLYASNNVDLLEARQTRGTNNELLISATYNAQHRPLTLRDAAGQTTTNSYNARGQLLTTRNPKGEITYFSYDGNGYLLRVDGPLPGTNDFSTFTHDSFGRIRTWTDESGYQLTFDYDAMDRPTKITYADASFQEYTYNRLDLAQIRDRAGRFTTMEYDNLRRITKMTDPLSRAMHLQWCGCGNLESITDALGRSTSWESDVQGRIIRKRYPDGSQIIYQYENTTGRLQQLIDEKLQITQFAYNRDNTIHSIAHANTAVPTPSVLYFYDTNYTRVVSIVDGVGTHEYSYHPMGAPGAGELAVENGPLANDSITHHYDELQRVSVAIDGVARQMAYDAAGRVFGETNALGGFAYSYDGISDRLAFQSLPNNQTAELTYFNNLQDRLLQRITHKVGATPVSEFIYGRDIHASRIATWSQQVGAQSPSVHTLGYDAANQLLSASVTNAGTLVNSFSYFYDVAGNRLMEQVGSTNSTATYNALNQLSARSGSGVSRTNEWDALNRLVAVNVANQRIEFSYDGFSRLASLRFLTNGVEANLRKFVWCDGEISEERDAAGVVTKRFFNQGVKLETGPNAGKYFYTRDHLGSVRELIDSNGVVRARYSYDLYGRRTKLAGDLDADFGFAGMFWSAEAKLNLTHFRAYDPELGRWLSRDPLENAEVTQGPNLYAYAANDPVNRIDPLGLAWSLETLQQFQRTLTPGQYNTLYEAFKRAHPNTPVPPNLRPTWTPPSPGGAPLAPGGGSNLKPSGDIMARPKGDIMLRPKGEIEKWKPRGTKSPVGAPPRPTNPGSPSRLPGIITWVIQAEITILTMTDCNVVNGILGLVRQGKGGSVNAYQDEMLKEIEDY